MDTDFLNNSENILTDGHYLSHVSVNAAMHFKSLTG